MTQSPSAERPILVAAAGAVAMAAAMGFGRFFYTPVLPGMMIDLPLSAADAGLIAAGNFAGYLAGAMLAAYGWAAGRERPLAISALGLTSLLLAAMAFTSSLPLFIFIRFLAGLASAFAMIFTASIVLPYAAGKPTVQSVFFAGVGTGIAVSSLVALLINGFAGDAAHGWRWNWLAGALLVILATVIITLRLPKPRAGHRPAREPPIAWTRPLVLLTASYGLFGFGYVVTATFLVAIARLSAAGPLVEFFAWFVTGIAAAVSLFLWRPVARRIGVERVYLVCLLVEAIGVVASVLMPPVAGTLLGGLALGLTFITITAYGLQIGGRLAPQSPRRALAFMTVAFGCGQIVGPLVAGWATQWSGSFTLASIIAALVLMISLALMLPLAGRVSGY
ncbi:YbfB/YjiJ family MFS transporter [Rhizobium sp. 0TCS1.26]|uniref:YbfB/YjiJ family MFS transporter n=1 Tax=Rhizobium sp. 0TCS1.26 TaxID=3142623 RepID=UPI003D2E09A1